MDFVQSRLPGCFYTEGKVNKLKKMIISVVLAIAFIRIFAIPAAALDDDEFNGYSADTLVVKVGYFGGPYYEKAVFTLNDLWALDIVYADYTFIDNMPSVVIDHVAGVRLSDIMAAAGIDLGSIQTFYFWTKDKASDYYTSYTKTELIDTPRYCYYSLPDNFDHEEGVANEYADSDAVRVDTLLSLADNWNRTIAGATFGSDYMNLNTNTRFRLVFGQTNTWEHTASRSAKWIHEIVVELGGAPSLTLDASVLDGEVGSVLRTMASVRAEEAVLQNEAVTWTSSDDGVATVDEDGNITIQDEGTAIITASFAGITASLTVNGSAAADSDDDLPQNSDHSNAEDGGSAASGETDAGPGGAPDDVKQTQAPASDDTQTLSISEDIGNAVQINPPIAAAENTQGGVQNWRVFAMSETAAELPDIQLDNPLSGFTGGSVAMLFTISGITYAVKFRFDVRGNHDVYKRKS